MKFSSTEAKAVDLVMELVAAKKICGALGGLACTESSKEPPDQNEDWPVFTDYRSGAGYIRSGYGSEAWPLPEAEVD